MCFDDNQPYIEDPVEFERVVSFAKRNQEAYWRRVEEHNRQEEAALHAAQEHTDLHQARRLNVAFDGQKKMIP